MRGKIYITDEGFGPIVRQSAILEEMFRINPSLDITLQSEKHLEAAKRIIPGLSYTKRYNNVTWHKQPHGTPDLVAIRDAYQTYLERSDAFLEVEYQDEPHDFIISDFVYEAFEVAHRQGIPSFGIAHFTWDWFFSKLYPPPVPYPVLERFFTWAELASVLYFPPFTPQEILRHYKHKVKEVPLIVRKQRGNKEVAKDERIRIMIIDSGSGVLFPYIKKSIPALSNLKNCHFFLSSVFEAEGDNITLIDRNELFVDYISEMDLVIGRAGFNTISECIALRTPMLLLGEAMNPEMTENILNIKQAGLGSFISTEQFTERLAYFLPRFLDSEYPLIQEGLNNHEIPTNGAKVVAEDLLNRLEDHKK